MKCIDCQCKIDQRAKRCLSCYKKHLIDTKESRGKMFRDYQKDWYQKNKPRLLKRAVERARLLPKEKKRSYTIKSKYGVTTEHFNNMLKLCDYKCIICRQDHSDEKTLHIDHNHISKKVRGLLCSNCNHGLGHFRDNISLLEAAIKYLKEND